MPKYIVRTQLPGCYIEGRSGTIPPGTEIEVSKREPPRKSWEPIDDEAKVAWEAAFGDLSKAPKAPPTAAAAPVCPSCGVTGRAKQRFCSECGASFEDAAPSAAAVDTDGEGAFPLPTEETGKKKGKKAALET